MYYALVEAFIYIAHTHTHLANRELIGIFRSKFLYQEKTIIFALTFFAIFV